MLDHPRAQSLTLEPTCKSCTQQAPRLPRPDGTDRRHARTCAPMWARGPPTQSPFRPTHAQRCWSSLSTGLALAPLPLALASVAQGELPNLNPPPRAYPRSLLSDPARTWPRGPAGKHRSRGTARCNIASSAALVGASFFSGLRAREFCTPSTSRLNDAPTLVHKDCTKNRPTDELSLAVLHVAHLHPQSPAAGTSSTPSA